MGAVAPELMPEDEEQRLRALLSYDLLDTPAEQPYDDLTRLAAFVCGTSMASLTLIDAQRQWFKSAIGLGAPQTPRDGFCSHCILQPDVLVVSDAPDDSRFAGHPFVIGDPHIRFYAGVTLVSWEGYALGTLCAIDPQPRTVSDQQIDALRALGRQAVAQLELRRIVRDKTEQLSELRELYAHVAASTEGQRPTDDRRLAALTEQEVAVVALVAEGLSNPEIGLRLYLSRHTVKEYLGNAMRKLGATSRVEAAVVAARHGLISLGGDPPRTPLTPPGGVPRPRR